MGKAPVIGLDIGTFAVRAVELVPGSGRPVLVRTGQVVLPPGAVVGGEVVDVAAVGAAITRLWEEAGFQGKDVIVGVTGQRVIVRQAELPAMSEEDLRAGLRYHAQDLLPISVDDAQLDVCVLDQIPGGEDEPKMHVLLAAASHEVVASHLAALDAAGLRPAAVDVLPLALLRAFPGDGPTGSEAFVSVGAGLTTVIVREAGIPRFVRVLGVGGDDITAAIGADLGCDGDYAEHLKRKAILAGDTSVATLSRANALVAEHVRPLVEEIRGSLDFYLAQADVDQIERLVLTGGGVKTPGLVAGLDGTITSQVIVADPFDAVEIGKTGLTPDDLRRASPVMAAAIGLALAGLPGQSTRQLAVNLLPEAIVVARRQRRRMVAMGAGVAALAVALGGVSAVQHRQVTAKETAVAEAQAQVTSLQRTLGKLAPVSAAQADLRSRQQSVGTVLADDIDFQRLIQPVTAVMPDDVWLTSFSAQRGAKAAPATVTFAATGLSEEAVVRWVRQVGAMPSITNLWVPSASKGTVNNGVIVTFASNGEITSAAHSDRAATLTGVKK